MAVDMKSRMMVKKWIVNPIFDVPASLRGPNIDYFGYPIVLSAQNWMVEQNLKGALLGGLCHV